MRFLNSLKQLKVINEELGKQFNTSLGVEKFSTRMREAVTALSTQKNEILFTARLEGLAAIQNQIRDLNSNRQLREANTVEPIKARTKAYDAEIKVLEKLDKAYSRLQKKNISPDEVTSTNKQIDRLNALLKANTQKEYQSQLAVQQRIDKLEAISSIRKLQAAKEERNISNEYTKRLAQLKQQETIGKNAQNNLSLQLKEVQQLLSEDRNRVRLAKELAKQSLPSLTRELNAAKDYKSTLQSVFNQFKLGWQSAKAEAQGYLNEQRGILNGKRELLAGDQQAIANQNLLIQKAQEQRRIQTEIAKSKIGDEQFGLTWLQKGLQALRNYKSELQDAAKVRVLGVRNQLFDATATINSLRQVQEGFRTLQSGAQLLGRNLTAMFTQPVNAAKTLYQTAQTELNRLKQSTKDISFDLKLGRLDLNVLNQYRKGLLDVGKAAAAAIQPQIDGLKQWEGLARRSINLGMERVRNLMQEKVAAKDAAETEKATLRSRLTGLYQSLQMNENWVSSSKYWLQNAKDLLSAEREIAKVRALRAQQTALQAQKDAEASRQTVVSAQETLNARKQELTQAKDQQSKELAALRVKEAAAAVDKANAAASLATSKQALAVAEQNLKTTLKEGAARAKAIQEEQRKLDILMQLKRVEKADYEVKKSDLSAQLAKENEQQRQAIQLATQRKQALQTQYDQEKQKLEELLTASQKANLQQQIGLREQIQSREANVAQIRSQLNATKEAVQQNKEDIATYKTGLKAYQDSIRESIRAVNERIALGQINKSQLQDEKKDIQANIREVEKLARAYEKTLQMNVNAAKTKAQAQENEIKELQKTVNALKGVAEMQELYNQKRRELATAEKTKGGLDEQVRQANDLLKSETARINALERSGRLFGIFVTQHRALKNVLSDLQKDYDSTNQQIQNMVTRSNAARGSLRNLANDASLEQVKAQAKSAAEQLNDLRRSAQAAGGRSNLAPTQLVDMANLQDQLKALNQVKRALEQIPGLQEKLNNLKIRIPDVKEYMREISTLNRFMQGFRFMLTPEMLGMSAFNMVIGSVQRMIGAFVQVNAAAETMIRGLDAVFGQGQGAVQFEKLTGIANKYGLALQDLSRNYLNLNASTKGTQLEGAESERIFKSLSAAMAVLGADTITTNRAFRAVGQMISKGQVYAEELKGQLAEALPGAVQLFAKSMGKTTQEFLAMVKAGQVGLNELIPFFREIEKQYGDAALASTTYEQATNRLSNEWTILLKNLGDTGVWQKVISLITGVSTSLKLLNEFFVKELEENLQRLEKSRPIQLRATIDQTEFDKFESVLVNGKQFKLTDIGLQENLGSYLKELERRNELNKQANEIIDEQVASYKKLNAEQEVAKLTDEINKIDVKQNSILTLEKFNAEIAKLASNEGIPFGKELDEILVKLGLLSADPLLKGNKIKTPLTGDELFSVDDYERYKAIALQLLGINQESRKSLEDRRKQLMEYLSNLGNEEKTAQQQIVLSKQLLREEKALLDIQQRSESVLQSIGAAQNSRLMKGQGISDGLITEFNNTQNLLRAYQAIAKAQDFETKFGAEPNEEQLVQIRQLQLDQLKYAETVARSANSQKLLLAIMKQQALLQQEQIDKTTQQISLVDIQSNEVKDTIRNAELALRKSGNVGLGFANSIYQAMAATEQHNRLLAQQAALVAKSAQAQREFTWEIRDAKDQADANAKSIRKSQQDQGRWLTDEYQNASRKQLRAQEAFAAAEEAYANARKSNNAEEITELNRIAEANLKVAQSAFVDAGYGFGIEKVKDLREAIIAYQRSLDEANIKAQQANLDEILKASTPEEIKQRFAELNTEIKKQLAIKDTAQAASTKAAEAGSKQEAKAQEELADRAARAINRLVQARNEAKQAYDDGVATGQFQAIEIDTSIKEQPVKDQLKKLTQNLQSQARQNPIDVAVRLVPQGVREKANEVYGYFTNAADVQVAIDPMSALASLELIRVRLDQVKQQGLIPIRFDLQDIGGFIRTTAEIKATQPLTYYVTIEGDEQLQNAKSNIQDIGTLLQTLPDGQFTIRGVDQADHLMRVLKGVKENGAIDLQVDDDQSLAKAQREIQQIVGKDYVVNITTKVVTGQDGFNAQKQVLTITPKIDAAAAASEGAKAGQVAAQASNEGWRKFITPTGAALREMIDSGTREAVKDIPQTFTNSIQASSGRTADIVRDALNRGLDTVDISRLLSASKTAALNQELLNAFAAKGITLRVDQVDRESVDGWISTVNRLIAENKAEQQIIFDYPEPETKLPDAKQTVIREYKDKGGSTSFRVDGSHASGGLIPGGYSRRDSYLAMLSPGEFVIPSNIVKKFGPDYFYDFIKNRRPSLKENISVPKFSNGGMMPSAGQPIVINLPGSKPIHLSGSRDAAAQLVKVLTQTGRAL
jgi:tape measure domain-containing protein